MNNKDTIIIIMKQSAQDVFFFYLHKMRLAINWKMRKRISLHVSPILIWERENDLAK